MIEFVRNKLLVILLIVISFNSQGDENSIENLEYKLKALYIIRLAAFITWPENVEKESFIICIDSFDPVAIQLKKSNVSQVKNRKIEVIDPPIDASLKQCDFLYYSYAEIDLALRKTPVVTISSQTDFAKHGGMIEFYIDHSKVKMKANLQAVNQAGIKLSSKLLRLLIIVDLAEDNND